MKIRWISTDESIAKGEPTVLAIVETLLAICAYWWIAWYYDTHYHLLISITIAPLLLLRSKESTEKGVAWFVAYYNDETKISPQETRVKL
ncbi:MAG: hypothetical protein HQL52_04045 [Magnetococcales bacterium]|nr:hypothetical protein [Magnetococcales bacterium]